MRVFADKSQNLSWLVLGNQVTCDNETMRVFANKSQNLFELFLGHRVTCDNATMKTFARPKLKILKVPESLIFDRAPFIQNGTRIV